MRQANRLAQAPLHAIALHCAAQCSPDCESDPQTLRSRPPILRWCILRCLGTRPIEKRHGRGKMPASLFVHALEIRMAQKPRRARKSCCFLWRHRDLKPISLRGIRHHALILRPTAGCLENGSERHSKNATRGSRASRRPASVLWRGGGKLPSGRPGSSCACESHASCFACAG